MAALGGASRSAIGLDIGTSLFRAAQLSPGSISPVLLNYGSIKVPVGSVVEGEIVDIEAAAYALSHLWKNSGFSQKEVVIGVASQRVVVRLVTMPYMSQEELTGAIQFQAQDYIPIPIEEAIVDAQIVNEFVEGEGERKMEVLLVAAQKDMIQNTVAAVESAGLRPTAIDLSSFALARSLVPEGRFALPEATDDVDKQGVGTAIALINISFGLTNIVVVEEGVPRFARVTPLAGSDLTQSIADALGLTFEEAEELKVSVGLPPLDESGPVSGDDLPENLRTHAAAAQNVLENQVTHFIAEIRRSLDYYMTQATEVREITTLILSGAGSKLRNFPAHLERGLQAKVEIGDPLAQLQATPKLDASVLEREKVSLAVSIGLALRDFRS